VLISGIGAFRFRDMTPTEYRTTRFPSSAPHHPDGRPGNAGHGVFAFRTIPTETVAAVERLGTGIAVEDPQVSGTVRDHRVQQQLSDTGAMEAGE